MLTDGIAPIESFYARVTRVFLCPPIGYCSDEGTRRNHLVAY